MKAERRLSVFHSLLYASVSLWFYLSIAQADEAWPPKIVRRLPPIAEPLPEADAARVRTALDEIRGGLASSPSSDSAPLAAGRIDVEILAKAIDYALRHGEFFDHKRDLARVESLRKLAGERIAALKEGKMPWAEQRGVSVRGFRSALDDSVQPYGLIVPEKLDLSKPVPLYVWLHGRGDTQCDLQFISNFLGPKAPGSLQPADAIVLHPFGRYCNGWKSAGEIDVFEAVADVKKRFKIDDDRIVLAGFSMGGAGAWHLGAHYADQWCAVHAGAGFVDVRRYQNITPDKMPPWYEQKLWGLYDVPDYRRNLLNVPVIAYSGEEDKQKAAADIMVEALAGEGCEIPHLIGPGMGHKYHPEVLADIHKRLAAIVAKGRDRYPKKVSLQTKTLRYNKMFWVRVDKLDDHWEDSRIDAEVTASKRIRVATKNVGAFSLSSPWKDSPQFDADVEFVVDDVHLRVRDSVDTVAFVRNGDGWHVATSTDGARAKHFGEQGPIDDAVVSPFTVVVPEATAVDSPADRWIAFESRHFIDRWRMLMRGEPRVKAPSDVTAEDLKTRNLLLWGTPRSNPLIAKIVDNLPIRWTEKTVGPSDLNFDTTKIVPMLIYPNPLNPSKYVVINGGLTFREAHDRTNSLQNPKLGDWAFIDVTEPPTDEAPGKVLAAGFFDENWRYVPQRK